MRIVVYLAAFMLIFVSMLIFGVITPDLRLSPKPNLWVISLFALLGTILAWFFVLSPKQEGVTGENKVIPIKAFVGWLMVSGVVLGFFIFVVISSVLEANEAPVKSAEDVQNLAQTVTFILGVLTVGGAAALQYRKQINKEQQTKIENQRKDIEEERKNADRWARYVEMLGSDTDIVRIGAIYALKKLVENQAGEADDIKGLFEKQIELTAPVIVDGGTSGDESLTKARTIESDLMRTVLEDLDRQRKASENTTTGVAPENRNEEVSPVNSDGQAISPEPTSQGDKNASEMLTKNSEPEEDQRKPKIVVGSILDFTGADFSKSDLRRRNFSGVSFSGARLIDADLTGANLANANLIDADLTGANLTNADLAGAAIKVGNYIWRILDFEDGKALIITEDVITQKRFDASSNNWSTSEIRQWLNSEFYASLNETIKSRILDTGNTDLDTTDKVFLLSAVEAIRYFKENSDRIATYNGEAHWWWLRSPGSYGSVYAAYVDNGGCVGADGDLVSNGGYGVRPALRLNLQSAISESLSP